MCPDKKEKCKRWSHPVRGAWIEILQKALYKSDPPRRTPSGVRGLKFWLTFLKTRNISSHPVRGAWIEIITLVSPYFVKSSHPVRGAWIEIDHQRTWRKDWSSHPVRGAWIEMFKIFSHFVLMIVAPRQGCVD